MLLLIDNYDSFTYNLVHYLSELGADVVVKRNDALDVQTVMRLRPTSIVLSPGPCDPAQAGICLPLTLAAAEANIPLLGVCLGHQTIGQAFAVYDQGMIAGGREGGGQVFEYTHPCVVHAAHFAMNDVLCAHDIATKSLPDGLVA